MCTTIVEFANNFINDSNLPRILDYDVDYSDEIEGLYIEKEIKFDIKNYYCKIKSARKDLSYFFSADFSDNNFLNVATEYLEAIKNLFLFYFKKYDHKSAIINRKILTQIVESDTIQINEDEIRIGIGNPMILESLVLAYLQIVDFKECNDSVNNFNVEYDYLISLNNELIINKIDRLFRDIIVLYNKEFYRIIGFDETNNGFMAVKEDSLCSIEKISATRLYEKIVRSASNEVLDQNAPIRALIIGSTIGKVNSDKTSLELLKEMLPKSTIVDVIDTKEEIGIALRQSELEKLVKEYNKVFILDCPEIYHPIELETMRDSERVIRRAEPNMQTIFGVDPSTRRRDFFNKNGFAAIFYRVQNYLIDMSRANTRKSRKINTDMLDYIKEVVATINENKDANNEVYVYISNNHDFRDELYDMYNFTRLERYNSKDCRIIRFGTDPKPRFKSSKCELHITYYKLLKMISTSEKFFDVFTIKNSFIESTQLAKNTHIFIKYGSLAGKSLENEKANSFNLKIKIYSEEVLNETYKSIVETLIREAFDFNSYKSVENKILSYCFKKAVANVFSGCAHNFNDLLFQHLYMQAVLGSENINFNVAELEFKNVTSNNRVEEETTSYSFKRVAYYLMNALDNDFYSEASIIGHFRRASINKENLEDYTEQILSACENIGYIDSLLYYRLNRYY